jgi:hypothetical protein
MNFIGQLVFPPKISLNPVVSFPELLPELQLFAAQVANGFGV